jgi:hypothetical protein
VLIVLIEGSLEINPAFLPISMPDKRLAPMTGALLGSYRTANSNLNPLNVFSDTFLQNLSPFLRFFRQLNPVFPISYMNPDNPYTEIAPIRPPYWMQSEELTGFWLAYRP